MATIIRDNYGVPHIQATTNVDAAKAIAYVHCEDDFLTIQLWFLAIMQKSGHFDDWDGPYLDFLSVFFDIKSKNIIAIGSNKSKKGNALIAISPHQMLEGIFSYYEIQKK